MQECKADSSGGDKDATIRILRLVICNPANFYITQYVHKCFAY